MVADVKPIPDGFHSITPHLVVDGASDAIAFYEKAFGAQVCLRMMMPDGRYVLHAELSIGDSRLLLADAIPEFGSRGPKALGGSPVAVHLYVEDADAAFERAIAAGATVTMPLSDMFWGDRYGRVTDPFGHVWSISAHVKDVAPLEMQAAVAAMFAKG